MLYIFHVDSGTMMTFEMNLALEIVVQLKEAIERSCGIPADKQVLLVSGGECLNPNARVCSYSAGTDTNPIYLFSKSTLESLKPPSPNLDYGTDCDMKELVDASLMLPATYDTVDARARLSQQLFDLAREHNHICERLVHDQHLQQQGWAAAVANLEDITDAFTDRTDAFRQFYQQHLESREENMRLLQNFTEDLQMLARIPILPALLSTALSFSSSGDGGSSTIPEEGEAEGEPEGDSKVALTLLQWISAADNQASLSQVAEQSYRGLQQLDEVVMESLDREIKAALEASKKNDMKEIKGLEERLFGLEQLMVETKKVVQEQSDLAQSFLQNQNRASHLKDASILPDLCNSHRRQLLVMLQNQNKLRDIRRRCSKAKDELSVNLYHRLGWVMYVENQIVDVGNKLMIYHENLKRLRRYLEITRQVQRAPQVYVMAVGEVVRRRTFSQAFLTWASDLSCRLLTVYNEEMDRRKDFQLQFVGHFLQSLFCGFEDSPPPFATQAPSPFDSNLPALTVRDLEQLKDHLPELSLSLSVTKLSAAATLLLAGSVSDGKSSDSVPVEERLAAAVTRAGLGSKMDEALLQSLHPLPAAPPRHLHKDDRDFESETDTEEFEKVCQSPQDAAPEVPEAPDGREALEAHPGTIRAEENLGSARIEVENLKFHLSAAGRLASEAASSLKTELGEMKTRSAVDKEAILSLVRDIQSHIGLLTDGYGDEIGVLHGRLDEARQEQDNLRAMLQEKEAVLASLTQDMDSIRVILEGSEVEKQGLTASLTTSQLKCEELVARLSEAEEQRSREVECLAQAHQLELDRLQLEVAEAKAREEAARAEQAELAEKHRTEVNDLSTDLVRVQLESEMEREKLVKQMSEKHGEEQARRVAEVAAELDQLRVDEVQRTTEKLSEEFRTELEGLRSRFRMMSANMEKSPSDSTLEKIERLDVIELVNHEAIVAQMKEDAAAEREKAVREALGAEQDKARVELRAELREGRLRMEEEKQVWLAEAVTRSVVDKDRQIEALLQRQDNLLTECQRHRDTIRLLTDGDHIRAGSSPGAGTVDPLLDRIDSLEREKAALVVELDRERRSKRAVEAEEVGEGDSLTVSAVGPVPCASLVTESDRRDVATSPEPSRRGAQGGQGGRISITSCSVGDAVLVVWNTDHDNYTILQESTTMHFLHSDSLDSLGLRPASDGSPRRLYTTAIVLEKEYCHAKKPENRYRVPKGTKFYRVKVRPMTREARGEGMSRSHHQPSTAAPGGPAAHQHQRHHMRHSLESGLPPSPPRMP